MRITFRALIVAGLLATAATAQAAGKDENGFQQIMAGDLAQAERMLVSEHKAFPADPSLSLNLALVYARTGRSDAARSLYLDVLARPNEEMDMAGDATGWSHELARRGLKRLEMSSLSTR